MLDLETIGYYLYMEEQENRSRELKQAAEREQASQEEQGQDISAFPGIHAPYGQKQINDTNKSLSIIAERIL